MSDENGRGEKGWVKAGHAQAFREGCVEPLQLWEELLASKGDRILSNQVHAAWFILLQVARRLEKLSKR